MKAEPGRPLSDEDIERLVSTEICGGLDHVFGADNIAAERDRNYDYYRGIMPDMPFKRGQSSYVASTVADYIGLMKPSLLRIVGRSRNIAEYVTPKSDAQKTAGLVTRFINDVVFRKDNRGELILYDWADDALVQKVGVAMWWWEEKHENRDEILEGIVGEDQLVLTAQDLQSRGIEIIEHSETQAAVIGPDGAVVTPATHSLKVRTKVNVSKCCIDTIPPEEFVISRDARNLEDAVLKAHRTGVTVGSLIDAGYDAEAVNALPSFVTPYPDRSQKYSQDPSRDPNRDSSADPMLRKVTITRAILRCDYDGSGLKDWYVVAGGSEVAPKLLEIQPYNYQIGFADFCPQPLPHTFYGRCPADRLSELQRVETVTNRQMLNSLYLAVSPQREVVKDLIISPDQLMNQSAGAPVLVKAAGAIREIPIPFVGGAVLGVQQYFDGRAEIASGVSRNSAGLDPEVLANQSATASANQHSAMLSRVEIIALIWSQGGLRKLFRGVFNCLKAYQDFARVVQIEGKPETVDPRQWADLDDVEVNINTGLGTGNRDRDLSALTVIGAAQKEAFSLLGPGNPVVDLKKLVRTEQLKAEAAGVTCPENFFSDPGDWQPQQPPPQPTPDIVYQADSLKEIEAGKRELERQKTIAEIASKERIAREKNWLEAMIQAEKLGVDRAKLILDAGKYDVDAGRIANDMAAESQPAA